MWAQEEGEMDDSGIYNDQYTGLLMSETDFVMRKLRGG
jgi:hypothetical protein